MIVAPWRPTAGWDRDRAAQKVPEGDDTHTVHPLYDDLIHYMALFLLQRLSSQK